MDKNTVKVHIYGSEYVIKGDADPDHIRRIADLVDRKMREVNKSGSIKSPLKVAILAALNIADEYFKTREDQKKQIEAFETKAQKLVDLLTTIEVPDLEGTPENGKEEVQEMTLFSQL